MLSEVKQNVVPLTSVKLAANKGFLLKNDYLISDSRTSTDLDFDHPALTQVTAPPPIARVQLGDNTEQYDLDDLVSKD